MDAQWTETHGGVEVRFETRLYPGRLYVWAYWRRLGATTWANVGDPDFGRGARAQMRKRALADASANPPVPSRGEP